MSHSAEARAFIQRVQEEHANGYFGDFDEFNILGRKESISATALDDITETGNIVIPSPNGTACEVTSSSGNDTLAGTGVQKVDVHYLDASNKMQCEEVDMDGASNVVLDAGIDFNTVQWLHATQVGSGGVAAGNIVVRDISTHAIIYEQISVGGNQSLSCRFKIPKNTIGLMSSWHATGVTKVVDVRLRATCERFDRTLTPGVFTFQDTVTLANSTSPTIIYRPALFFPELCEIKVSSIADVVGGGAAASFQIIIRHIQNIPT